MLCEITLSCECFNTLVANERSYISLCQHVRVQISNSSASVVALTAFVILLHHVHPNFILKLGACTQGRHWLHLCAFSPVCVILCFCNLCMFLCARVITLVKL